MSRSMGENAPIHRAAQTGDVAQVAQILRDEPAQVRARGYAHNTPLHLAMNAEVARALIDRGADVNARGWMGARPLHEAALHGHADVVGLLLEAGAEVNTEREDGATPLHFAATGEVARMLVEHGADVHAMNDLRQTPLHRCAGVEEIVALLLAKGARVDVWDKLGKTPLHHAAKTGAVGSAQLLLAAGANLDDCDPMYGFTPLHEAVREKRVAMVQFLLDREANRLLRSGNGETPLHMARVRGNQEIGDLLAAGLNIVETRALAPSEPFAAQRVRLHPTRDEAVVIGKDAMLARWDLTGAMQRVIAVQIDIPWIHDVAVAPAGDVMALATTENAVQIRRWKDLQLIGRISAPIKEGLTAAVFSPDGQWLAVADGQEQILLIEYTTGRLAAVIEGGEWTSSVIFDPSSRFLASACSFQGGGHVRIDRIDEDSRVTPVHELDRSNYRTPAAQFVDSLASIAFSPDGRWLALYETSRIYHELHPQGWYGNLALYDADIGALRWQLSLDARLMDDNRSERVPPEVFHTEVVFHSADEVACGTPDGEILCFAVSSEKLTRRVSIQHIAPVRSLAFNPRSMEMYAVLGTGELARAVVS